MCGAQEAEAVVSRVRNLTDIDYGMQMAAMNRKLRPQVETVFLLPDAPLQCISSTLVREISKLGCDVSQMVSPAIAAPLRAVHPSNALALAMALMINDEFTHSVVCDHEFPKHAMFLRHEILRLIPANVP